MSFIKKYFLFIFISVLLWNSACSKKTQAVTQAKEQNQSAPAARQDSVPQNLYRFIVSFYSTGEGAEGKQIQQFEKFLSGYKTPSGDTLHAEKTPWGREGEVDYCMKLSGLNSDDQQQFINQVKELLKSAQRVHYSENAACRQGRPRRQ